MKRIINLLGVGILLTTLTIPNVAAGTRVYIDPWWTWFCCFLPAWIAAEEARDTVRPARIDCDVQPDNALFYIDGEYVGRTGQYDGHPGYYHLQPGTYDLEFRLDGYQTYAVNIRLQAGQLIRIHQQLRLNPPGRRPAAAPPWTYPEDTDDSSQSEYQQQSTEPDDYSAEYNAIDTGEQEMGYLVIEISPQGASVYVNGDFSGLVGDFDGSVGRMVLPPGTHEIVVVHPDYQRFKKNIEIIAGEEITINGELSP